MLTCSVDVTFKSLKFSMDLTNMVCQSQSTIGDVSFMISVNFHSGPFSIRNFFLHRGLAIKVS